MKNVFRFENIKLYIIFLLMALVLFCYVKGCNKELAAEEQRYTELEVHNVYSSVSVKLEIKCDWNSDLEEYRFHQIVTIPKNSKVVVKSPWGMKKCECWPLSIDFF
ncbi:MAG: hypothetical protein Q8P81_03250 [Nanoarchaeota archaeon]|nr:hypothetical protein [Nanoarchaeota archaeon]